MSHDKNIPKLCFDLKYVSEITDATWAALVQRNADLELRNKQLLKEGDYMQRVNNAQGELPAFHIKTVHVFGMSQDINIADLKLLHKLVLRMS